MRRSVADLKKTWSTENEASLAVLNHCLYRALLQSSSPRRGNLAQHHSSARYVWRDSNGVCFHVLLLADMLELNVCFDLCQRLWVQQGIFDVGCRFTKMQLLQMRTLSRLR